MANRRIKKKRAKAKTQAPKKYVPWTDEEFEALRREQNIKKIKKAVKKLKPSARGYDIVSGLESLTNDELRRIAEERGEQKLKSLAGRGIIRRRYEETGQTVPINAAIRYNSSGENINRPINVYGQGEATIQMDMLLSIARYGEGYTSMKADRSAEGYINNNGRRLVNVIISARQKHSDDELVQRINREYGSVRLFAEILERLILAVYDKEYAEWAGGEVAFNTDWNELVGALDW